MFMILSLSDNYSSLYAEFFFLRLYAEFSMSAIYHDYCISDSL